MNRAIILLAALLLAACQGNKSSEDKGSSGENGRPHTISVSILPQKYFVEQIAGDLVEVNVMIPPGASPATYEPTPAQLAALTKSEIYMKMGYTGFEMSWMEKLTAANKNMQVVNLSDGIDLIMEKSVHDHEDHDQGQRASGHGHHHGGIDPHTWLSPVNVKIISKNILDVLGENYPEHRDHFTAGYGDFLSRLDSLDAMIRAELSGMDSISFFTYHPSLSYFARDYGLQQIPLELMGKSPSAGYLRELVDLGKQKDIDIVFLQMQFDQHNAEVLAREIGAELVQINPLDPEWYDQMLFITGKLTE